MSSVIFIQSLASHSLTAWNGNEDFSPRRATLPLVNSAAGSFEGQLHPAGRRIGRHLSHLMLKTRMECFRFLIHGSNFSFISQTSTVLWVGGDDHFSDIAGCIFQSLSLSLNMFFVYETTKCTTETERAELAEVCFFDGCSGT